MRQGRRQRWGWWLRGFVAAVVVCAFMRHGRAEAPAASTSPAAWAGGGGTNAAGGSGVLPYWQAPPLPSAVIQGGTIPPGWAPQPVPYQGVGPDGRPLTMYYSPTYVFTYQIGPPVLAAAAAVPTTSQVNRRQATAVQPATVQGWNYQTQGASPPNYALPPATVARYQPTPYQYPPGAPALSGTPIVPPQGMPQAPSLAAAAPTAPMQQPGQWGPGQPLAPPPAQWGASTEAQPMAPASAAPQNPVAQGFAAAAPAAIAGTAGALATSSQPPPATPFPASAGDSGIPAQPVSSTAAQPSATGRSGSPRLWRVVGVNDGDTLTCLDESNQQQKVRLADIDAPELSQDFGKVSREALASMVFGKTVEVVDEGKDRYGRWIGHLSVNGIDVNRQMVATGNAWHYAAYSHDDSLAAVQSQAQTQRIGLWAQPSPQPPWEYRASAGKTPPST